MNGGFLIEPCNLARKQRVRVARRVVERNHLAAGRYRERPRTLVVVTLTFWVRGIPELRSQSNDTRDFAAMLMTIPSDAVGKLGLRPGIVQKTAVLANQLPVHENLATVAQIANHIPMQTGSVCASAFWICLPDRSVKGPTDFLIE